MQAPKEIISKELLRSVAPPMDKSRTNPASHDHTIIIFGDIFHSFKWLNNVYYHA